MTREMPSRALDLYAKFNSERETDLERYTRLATRNKEKMDRAVEEAIKASLVRVLFKQGTNVLDEFRIALKETGDMGTEPASSFTRTHTPSVALDVQGEEVNFIIQGWFNPNHLSPKSQSPKPYEYISVHRVKEGTGSFEANTDWLFYISEGKIVTPFDEAINDPKVIVAASDIFDVIRQSLSETHIPRSQQVRPEPEKKGLPKFLSRLPFAAKRAS